MSLKRSVSAFAIVAVCAACSALAESAAVSGVASESSSSLPELSLADGMASMPAAAGNGNHYGQDKWKNKLAKGYALEFGGGFNAPTSDSSPYITWGGNFTVGAGYNFSPRFALLAEYQFIDSKLPGAMIAKTYDSLSQDAANGGNAHIWSFGLEPVVSLFPKRANDIYVTGGGGFYRKMTNFTYPEVDLYCDYYYGCDYATANQVVGHFATNQGGVNIGLGYQRRLGGEFHDSRMKLFAEARYLHVFSPAGTYDVNPYLTPVTVGKGTEIIPVTFGIRW
jgi:hypothetical protein